jgi:hypothetical protein
MLSKRKLTIFINQKAKITLHQLSKQTSLSEPLFILVIFEHITSYHLPSDKMAIFWINYKGNVKKIKCLSFHLFYSNKKKKHAEISFRDSGHCILSPWGCRQCRKHASMSFMGIDRKALQLVADGKAFKENASLAPLRVACKKTEILVVKQANSSWTQMLTLSYPTSAFFLCYPISRCSIHPPILRYFWTVKWMLTL